MLLPLLSNSYFIPDSDPLNTMVALSFPEQNVLSPLTVNAIGAALSSTLIAAEVLTHPSADVFETVKVLVPTTSAAFNVALFVSVDVAPVKFHEKLVPFVAVKVNCVAPQKTVDVGTVITGTDGKGLIVIVVGAEDTVHPPDVVTLYT